ncbi:NlpC/P60 family protein [Mycolicibacterium fortuitum]|uniref:C40 family peptidase n=2 Tax=Mycolicibacterium fortuitum TaxID=1766 RepID=A0AAE5AGH3_MYCFO|nr:C40 family peptidase [Mycolicibacterium fortuitum]MCV7144248.1 peptidoglycan endopeptidase [Mycolicibacterium fortuitum]MDV7195362.1 C40 family peptidase [Mycolicibacterium fortuitum]MDV7209053.1 C40 family peptidase [Mycolicibacterium fortuitum]MDV7230905.1 C40 family peptidase [Mycolicibacterium fortuitum]MDV7262476.1 C40 family peptidase [Mycolicibacterium fortuitum]
MTTPPTDEPRRSVLKGILSAAAMQGVRKVAVSAGSAVVGFIGWPVLLAVAAAVVLLILVLVVTAIVALSRMSDQRNDFNYQCESRLGFSVGNTASLAVVPRLATSVSVDQPPATTWESTALQPATTTPPTTTPTTTPTTPTTTVTSTNSTSPANPYATLTAPPTADAKTVACVNAMRTGDLVGQPVTSPGNATGRLAAEVANQQVGLMATDSDGSSAGPTNNAFSAANLVRYAYYQASGGEVSLPKDVADQIDMGDRVDPSAISPGDLVFFNFTPVDGPTAVMIAITPTLGIDATALNQPIAVGVLPTGNVIVKRPRTHAEQEVSTP